jgi:transposase
MPGPKATSPVITDVERKALVHLVNTGDEDIKTKAEVLLRTEAGESIRSVSKELKVSTASVIAWKKNWNSSTIRVETWEEAIDKIQQVLKTGTGRPKKCKQEQVAKIIEIGTWSNSSCRSRHAQNELIASEAVRRGIVSDISPRSVGRLLEKYAKEAVST